MFHSMSSSRRWLSAVLLLVLLLPGGQVLAAPPDPPALPEVATVSPEGNSSFAVNLPFPIYQTPAAAHLPAIAYNLARNQYLVVGHTSYDVGRRDVWGQRMSSSGQMIGDPLAIANEMDWENFQPSVAYDIGNDRFLVVWVRSPNSNGTQGDVWGRFVAGDGSAMGVPFLICDWASSQWGPRVSYTPWPLSAPSFLVVWWNEAQFSPNYIAGRMVRADGTMPYNAASIASGTDNRQVPAIATNPGLVPDSNRHLVVYEVGSPAGPTTAIHGQFVTSSGSAAGSEFLISDAAQLDFLQQSPAAASCVTEYAVVYQRNVNQHDVYLQLIDLAGAKQGPIQRIAWSTGDETQPDVACGGNLDRYLVTWRQEYAGGLRGISARLAYPDGTLGYSYTIARPDTGVNALGRPVVASNSPFGWHFGFMAAWERVSLSSAQADVWGAIMMTTGTWLPLVLK